MHSHPRAPMRGAMATRLEGTAPSRMLRATMVASGASVVKKLLSVCYVNVN
jgi:hypothetical protein